MSHNRHAVSMEFYQELVWIKKIIRSNIGNVPLNVDKNHLIDNIFNSLLFFWFLQEHRFLNDDKNYFKTKFNRKFKNFFKDFFLRFLFEGVSVPINERSEEIKFLIGSVPYINIKENLLTELDLDILKSIQIDDSIFFQDKSNSRTFNSEIAPLFNFLKTKKWSIDENSQTYGVITPEIFGIILERRISTKNSGIIYTPSAISSQMCKHAIVEYINKKMAKSYPFVSFDQIIKIENLETRKKVIYLLENATILDPTCGSGQFLIEMLFLLEFLLAYLQPNRTKLSLRNFVINNNVFGIDINSEAVQVTKIRLLLTLFATANDINDATNINISWSHFQTGNSLIDDFFFNRTNITPQIGKKTLEEFDVIIGNPPYVPWNEIESTQKKALNTGKYLDLKYRCRPNHPDAQPNYYLFFIIKSLHIIKKNGIIIFILPQEWTFHKYTEDFRNFILKKSKSIYMLVFQSNYKIFRSNKIIGTTSLILILNSLNKKPIIFQEVSSEDETIVKEILARSIELSHGKTDYTGIKETIIKNKENLINKPWKIQSLIQQKLRNYMKNQQFVSLSDPDFFSVVGGFQPSLSRAKTYTLDLEDFNKLPEEERKYCYPVIYHSKNIKNFQLQKTLIYWIVLNNYFTSEIEFKKSLPNLFKILKKRINRSENEKYWEFPNVRNLNIFLDTKVKILSPRTAKRNTFAIDLAYHLIKGTNTAIISKKMSPYYILGILNSSLASIWYHEFGYDYHKSGSKKYEPAKIKEYMIPIPRNENKIIVSLTKKIIFLFNSHKEDSKHELNKIFSEINLEVYKHYGITHEEIKVIESLIPAKYKILVQK